MTPSTIIIFSAFYDPWMSGAERFVEETVARLKGRYYFIIYTSRLSRGVAKVEKRDGYEIRRVGFGASWDKWLFPLMAGWSARCSGAVVAHAVMESYAAGALWVFSLLRPRVPTLLTLQCGEQDAPRKQRYRPFWLWRLIHRFPDRVTAISQALANRALRLGVPKERLTVIPNGVDLTKFKQRNPEVRIPHRVVTVARLSWEKGIDILLQAFAHVRQTVGDATLVIVGSGPLRASLEAVADHLGVRDAVTFCGKLPHDQALQEMATADVFVCPSLAEGLGIVFLEAQALGVPVIGTRVGGIPDVIEDGKTGLLVPPSDARALAQAMLRLMQDQTFAHVLTEQALQRVKRFDWSVIVEELDRVYQSLLV